MKYLLDTHTFIWLDSEPEKLSKTALNICQNAKYYRRENGRLL